MLWILLITVITTVYLSMSIFLCLLCTPVTSLLLYTRITSFLKDVFSLAHAYSTQQNKSLTPDWELYYYSITKHLIKTSLTITTINTTKSTITTIYYLTVAMNSFSGHVNTTTVVCTLDGFSQTDFWKWVGTWRLRAVLCLNALLF